VRNINRKAFIFNMNPASPSSPDRRQALLLLALGAGTAVAQVPAPAPALAPYPADKAVKIVVPFAAGAGTDAIGRLMAQKLGEVMNASVVVENRSGASGAIGTQFVAQAPADGYTLLLVASPFTTVAASLTSAGYDPLKQFAPVGMIASGPLVWATSSSLPISNLSDLVRLARQKPGALNYGSAGSGSINHLVLELFKARTQTFITHIPYRGVAPAVMDLIGGQIQLVTGTVPALLPFIREGRIKPLAVTSAKRSSALSWVPGMVEAGFQGVDVSNYFALVAPRQTPMPVITALNAAINNVIAQPDVLARFKTDAVVASPGSAQALRDFIAADYRTWRNVVTTQNLKIE
jgi:tripartite-type tricarboxylate transporter receptor subunit TctC